MTKKEQLELRLEYITETSNKVEEILNGSTDDIVDWSEDLYFEKLRLESEIDELEMEDENIVD